VTSCNFGRQAPACQRNLPVCSTSDLSSNCFSPLSTYGIQPAALR
jgi:hypothetical protein